MNKVKIKVIGKNPRLFIKRSFINKNVFEKYKEISRNEITLTTSYSTYLMLISPKSSYKIEVIKYYGIIGIKKYVQDNPYFLVSALVGLIFLFFLSKLTFDIDVIHNDKKIRTLIAEELYDNNIRTFYFLPNFNKISLVKNNIINNNKDKIEWLEIEKIGSKIIVKVTERKINKKEDIINNRHIVASKDGIITKIEAEKGTILKKTNDYVKKGDIIISGDIIKDETVKGQVVSKGVVYAETWYNVKVEYPLYYKEIIYTNNIKSNIIIEFFSKKYSLRSGYENAYLERKKYLIKSNIIPFTIRKERQRKTIIKKQVLTKEKAIKKALVIATKKIKTKLDDDEFIIDKKTLSFSVKESKIVIDVFFKVCENITDYKDVEPIIIEDE
ncbi:MAG: sporulation protein YqfD [Bacilli bacterium]